MFRWLKRLFQSEPTNQEIVDAWNEVIDAIEDLESEIAEISAQQKAFEIEIWEMMDAKLEPLSRRINSRISKSEEKDLNSHRAMKRTGIIPYGSNKQS